MQRLTKIVGKLAFMCTALLFFTGVPFAQESRDSRLQYLHKQSAYYASLGRYADAIDYRERVRGIDPKNAYNLWYLADYHTKLGDWERAHSIVREVVDDYADSSDKTIPLDRWLHLSGLTLTRLGQLDDAFAAINRSLSINPDNFLTECTLDEIIFRNAVKRAPITQQKLEEFAEYQESLVYLDVWVPEEETSYSLSGFMYGNNEIVTTWHGYSRNTDLEITVILNNGRRYPLRSFKRGDPFADYAVFKVNIPERDFVPLPVAKEAPEVDDFIYIPINSIWASRLGQPGVKGKVRFSEDRHYAKAIFVDAPASPGMSGSPALNADGELVGFLTGGDRVSHHCLNQRVLVQVSPISSFSGKSTRRKVKKVSKWLEEDYSPAVDHLWRDAIEAIEKSDEDKATAILVDYTGTWPKDYRAWLALAYVQASTGDLDALAQSLEQVFALKENFAYARPNEWLGEIMLAQGNYEAAADYFNRALEIVGCAPELRLKISKAYMSAGLERDAMGEAIVTINENPEFGLAYLLLGEFQFNKGETGAAKRLFEMGLEKFDPLATDSAIAKTHYYLGSIALSQNDESTAAKHLKELQARGATDLEAELRQIIAEGL